MTQAASKPSIVYTVHSKVYTEQNICRGKYLQGREQACSTAVNACWSLTMSTIIPVITTVVALERIHETSRKQYYWKSTACLLIRG